MRNLLWIVVAIGVLGDEAPVRADELAKKIREVMSRPEYKHARWGICVVDVESNRTLHEVNADQFFAPASVTKLYSCAAALLAFGPEHRFETLVHRRGEVKDGVLKGDLILVAQGDLTLGGRTRPDGTLAFRDVDHTYANWITTGAALTDTDPLAGLRELAKQVKAHGVRRIDGDVLIDDRLFERTQSTGSGPGILTPIVVNDNLVDLVITPGPNAGAPASIDQRPRTAFLAIDARIETIGEGKPTPIQVERVGPQRFVVRGQVKQGDGPSVRAVFVDEPAGFARALFLDALRSEGVTATASDLRPPNTELPHRDAVAQLPRVARLESPPLRELVRVTLKVSHNLYAGTLPLLLAARKGKRSLPEGLALQGKILGDLGLDREAISFDSAAGGGDADKVTPRATVQLMQLMRKRPEFAPYRAGLPLLGVDGTLAKVVPTDSPARGKAAAKTGTYVDNNLLTERMHLRSKALAGYLTTANNRELLFCLFVNDVPLPKEADSTREGKALGRICELLHEFAP